MSSEKESSSLCNVSRLLSIMEDLRHPETGCPWDAKQSMESLTRYTIEEAYEVADAIKNGDRDDIKDELGDLLFQVVFYARIAEEEQDFNFDDVAKAIGDKLVRRHPHVFADASICEDALSQQWDAIKAQERAAKGQASESILDTVPGGLPALMYAQKIQKKCAKIGFDWPTVKPVLDKVREEVQEIQDELETQQKNQQAIEEEIGDLLFATVNLARHCNVDSDTALRNASHKFAARFKLVEQFAAMSGLTLDTMSLSDMESLWQRAKQNR